MIQSFELVVGGSGPTALSFLEALLESGYPEHKVLHVAGSQNLADNLCPCHKSFKGFVVVS